MCCITNSKGIVVERYHRPINTTKIGDERGRRFIVTVMLFSDNCHQGARNATRNKKLTSTNAELLMLVVIGEQHNIPVGEKKYIIIHILLHLYCYLASYTKLETQAIPQWLGEVVVRTTRRWLTSSNVSVADHVPYMSSDSSLGCLIVLFALDMHSMYDICLVLCNCDSESRYDDDDTRCEHLFFLMHMQIVKVIESDKRCIIQ